LFGITDQVARQNALASGDIQMMSDLDKKAIKSIESNSDLPIHSVESGAYTNYVLILGHCVDEYTFPRFWLEHATNGLRYDGARLWTRGTVERIPMEERTNGYVAPISAVDFG
jgi:hypothetical protein